MPTGRTHANDTVLHRRKLQRSVSETETQEDFSKLAAIKLLVSEVKELRYPCHVQARGYILAGNLGMHTHAVRS